MGEFNYINFSKENPAIININNSATEHLYHYTRMESFFEILRNKKLWISQADFLNDSSEIDYIQNVMLFVADELNNNKERYRSEMDYEGRALEMFIKCLTITSKAILDKKRITDMEVFILSLTENKDSLNLFTNYSNSDGIAIGFQNNLEEMFDKNFLDKNKIMLFHGKVIYDSEQQKEILKRHILEVYNELMKNLNKLNVRVVDEKMQLEMLNEITLILGLYFINYSIFFKSPYFKAEEEYRVAFGIDRSKLGKMIKFRMRQGLIVPYIELKYNEKFINSLVIGPTNKSDLTEKGLNLYYANQCNGRKIKIEKSQIPLRAL
ncbi:DUF2971 domain-containing protein [Candidatus Clostridium helianthi]|uniref:DUF2971 domain-containing protein n=1 Tax=Candidatus Clostridium helianthi TaxID=3381660 RepID=A0ABW8SBQ9_9CLOT